MPVAPAVSHAFSREKLLQIARSLPADLGVLAQIGRMLQDINSELEEVAALLRRDVALAARIVRISNSPMFGGGQVSSIEEAVNRVGFAEILKLVGTATAARFTESGLDSYGIGAQRLRHNMLYGALACEALARAAGADTRIAYTAGLLRPLGMMVLERAARGHLGPHQRYSSAQWPTYSAWEGSLLGVDNCEVAALILEEWRFPADLSGAVRAHHLARPIDFDSRLGALVNVANGLAHRVTRSFPGEALWWGLTAERLAAAGLNEADFDPAIQWTETAFEAALAALQA